MPSLNMEGPYELTREMVDEVVADDQKGNYALGNLNSKGGFSVLYIGRSDSDIKKRLLYWIDAGNYSHFKFSYADPIKEVFEKECHNYHDFNPKDNDIHPDRPKGKTWPCPRCNIFD